jgi:hypothetical protein
LTCADGGKGSWCVQGGSDVRLLISVPAPNIPGSRLIGLGTMISNIRIIATDFESCSFSAEHFICSISVGVVMTLFDQ